MFKRFFKKKENKELPKDIPVSLGEIGINQSLIYGPKDFQPYNPDELYWNKGHGVYEKMLKDDQVKAVLFFKQFAVTSRNYSFDIDHENKEHEKQADFFKTVIKRIEGSWTDKLLEVLSSMKYGYSVVEKVYKSIQWEDKEHWGIKDLKLRPFYTFDGGFISDKHGNLERLQQNLDDGTEIKIPIDRVIHFVNRPDENRFYGLSDLKAAYDPWWSKQIANKFENIHLERHAHGFVWAQIDPSKGELTPTQLTALENTLDNITAQTSMRVPASVDINTVQPLRTDAYDKAIARHNRAIAISLLVPNLLGISEQSQHGSFAQSQTQLETFFWVLDYISTSLAEVLNEQLFLELSILNFSTEDFPLFFFEPISDEQKLNLAKVWSELVSKGSVTKSDSDESYLRDLLGFPEKTEKEIDDQDIDDTVPVDIPDLVEIDDWLRDNKKDKETLLKEFAEKPWLKRCNFVKIEKFLNNQDKKFALETSVVMGQVKSAIEKQVVKLAGEKSFGNISPKEINNVFVPPILTSKLRAIFKSNLKEILEENYSLARKELPIKRFVKTKPGMSKKEVEKVLASKSMRGVNNLSNFVKDKVHQVIENGIKFDKTLKEIIIELDRDADLGRVLPKVDSAGRIVNIPQRIETIARTNSSDVMNQARLSLFNDPELKGFVKAYEYSAILDDRTTEICEHLNGKIQRDFGSYTPPNHFNCRSILTAVTEIDDWDEKEDNISSRIEPHQGFK